MKKTIIIVIVSLLIGGLLVFGFGFAKSKYEQRLLQERNAGAINQLNVMYEQAKTGELLLRSIIVENGKVKITNGQAERGEEIRLIKEVLTE